MRELVDKQLMLEDVKSWVAMDSYEQHLINNMSAWIENLPSVHQEIIRCGDCIHYNKHKDCIKYQRDGFCSEWARNTYKYWYCSRAERETDD